MFGVSGRTNNWRRSDITTLYVGLHSGVSEAEQEYCSHLAQVVPNIHVHVLSVLYLQFSQHGRVRASLQSSGDHDRWPT